MEITSFFLKTDAEVRQDAGSFLRGAIASLAKEKSEFHNHIVGGGYLYTYPIIQYKIINGIPAVLAIGEAADSVRQVLQGIEALTLGKEKYKILGVLEKKQSFAFAPCKPRNYRFLTPYVALNSENAEKYKKFKSEKAWLYLKDLKESILIGNVLSLCKGLKIVVENDLRAKCFFRETRVYYRGIVAVGFVGRFVLNYSLPDLIGLGRGVSEGWGTIEALPSEMEGADASDSNGDGKRSAAQK